MVPRQRMRETQKVSCLLELMFDNGDYQVMKSSAMVMCLLLEVIVNGISCINWKILQNESRFEDRMRSLCDGLIAPDFVYFHSHSLSLSDNAWSSLQV